ncbi:response regulator transcription factor [Paenibacillus arenilitoris]|uniref:Response regulator n=1 Tax=Paenibacillus arenilitoris TaxID=2772299 RepID=A0A927H415_9BACL|nr:response regulator [Paenibacillus arenilitoris]MBD2866988.1 response regulator [Paenibacillus arenilitoris]
MIKVLIVDDDNLVRKGLMSILPWEQYNMEVVGEAKNGEKALAFLASNQVDLLLTDLAMPVMSGMELMRIVRKQYPHIFIVVLTLHQDFEYIQECLRLGAIDYIAKVEMEQENFGEVMLRVKARIMEEQLKNGSSFESGEVRSKEAAMFYDVTTETSLHSINENMLSELKKRGQALGWVHRASEFERFLEDLQNMQLPPAKLTSFLHSQLMAWDRVYASVTEKQIEPPDKFHSWLEVKEWLYGVRELLVDAIGKAQYSEEVKDCIARAVQAMHDELAGSVHASEMAKRVNMSRSYFSQCFKDLIGMTFNEYLRHIRMEKAKDYLQYTQKTIQWITENTGYTDQKYFSRVFHEKTGMLPSEYRQATQSVVRLSE